MKSSVQSFYGNRLRLRVCGICTKGDSILLINHQGIKDGNFWAPPGGGLQFGETSADCLIREFREETGLLVEPKGFLFACEFIQPPLHAVELFFEVSPLTDQLQAGHDPESGSPQVIKEIKFMSWSEVATLAPEELHGVFGHLKHPAEITSLKGYFKV